MGKMSELHIKIQDELMNSIHQVEQGEITCLDALIEMEKERKDLENSLAIIKEFKHDKLNEIAGEAGQYPDGYNGFVVEVRSGGIIYNYKNIEEWKTYTKAVKDCEDRHKQAFISKQKGLLVASSDGEELELPEISYRKSSVVVKAKNK